MPSFSVRPTSIPTREVDRAEEAAVRAEVAAEKVGQTIDLATQLIKDVADVRVELAPIMAQFETIPGTINAAINNINNVRAEALDAIEEAGDTGPITTALTAATSALEYANDALDEANDKIDSLGDIYEMIGDVKTLLESL